MLSLQQDSHAFSVLEGYPVHSQAPRLNEPHLVDSNVIGNRCSIEPIYMVTNHVMAIPSRDAMGKDQK